MLSHTQTTKEEKTYMGMGQHLVLLPSGNLLQFANWKMAIEIVIIVDFPIKKNGDFPFTRGLYWWEYTSINEL